MMSIRTNIDKFNIIAMGKKIGKANSVIPRQAQWFLYRISLVIVDAVLIILAFRLAYYFRFEAAFSFFDQTAVVDPSYYRSLVMISSIGWLIIIAFNGLYNQQNLLGGTREYSMMLRSSTEGFLILVIAGFLVTDLLIARGWLLMTWAFTFVFASSGRFILRRIVYTLRRHGFFLTPAVIVGANQEGRWLAEQLLTWETSGLHLVGFVDKKEPATTPLFHNLVCLGSVDQLGDIIERYQIGEVILASSAISTRDYLMDIFKKYGVSENVNLRLSSGLYEIITTGLTVNEFAYVPLVYVNKVRLAGSDETLK
ncbi:MAG TPA: hypothetical protein VK141_06300, partial [Nitrosomonas sp.]|nr:hypothetical protein [Nitrosomonas sp.]